MKKRLLRIFVLLALLLVLLASAQEEEPEAFVPSENVPADSGVAFPVDI